MSSLHNPDTGSGFFVLKASKEVGSKRDGDGSVMEEEAGREYIHPPVDASSGALDVTSHGRLASTRVFS